MSENKLNLKIELLEDQIENLEKSGFFTEKEMDRLTNPLKKELDVLQSKSQHNLKEEINYSVTPKYGNE